MPNYFSVGQKLWYYPDTAKIAVTCIACFSPSTDAELVIIAKDDAGYVYQDKHDRFVARKQVCHA